MNRTYLRRSLALLYFLGLALAQTGCSENGMFSASISGDSKKHKKAFDGVPFDKLPREEKIKILDDYLDEDMETYIEYTLKDLDAAKGPIKFEDVELEVTADDYREMLERLESSGHSLEGKSLRDVTDLSAEDILQANEDAVSDPIEIEDIKEQIEFLNEYVFEAGASESENVFAELCLQGSFCQKMATAHGRGERMVRQGASIAKVGGGLTGVGGSLAAATCGAAAATGGVAAPLDAACAASGVVAGVGGGITAAGGAWGGLGYMVEGLSELGASAAGCGATNPKNTEAAAPKPPKKPMPKASLRSVQ